MTDPISSNDALALAYVYGELSDDARRAFEATLGSDPALRAEVDGLLAMQTLLGDDAAFGEASGLDIPPPHLFDAILKDESIARSHEVKEAILKRETASSAGLLSKLSTWLVGGGALVGAAAVVLLFVSRGNAPNQVPEMAAMAPSAPMATPTEVDATDAVKREAGTTERAKETPREERVAERPEGQLLDEEATTGAGDSRADKRATRRVSVASRRKPAEAPAAQTKTAAPKKPTAKDAPEDRRAPRIAPLARAEVAESSAASDDLAFSTDFDGEEEAAPADVQPKPDFKGGRSGNNLEQDQDVAQNAPGGGTIAEPATEKLSSDGSEHFGVGRGSAAAAPAPTTAMPPPPPAANGPPKLDAATRDFARRQREAMAPEPKPSAKKSRKSKEDFRANAVREQRLRDVEKVMMTAMSELGGGRPAEAWALFEQAEVRGRGLPEIGLSPVLGQVQSLERMGRKAEALNLVVKAERAGMATTGREEVLAEGARIATDLGNRSRARALWTQLLASKRFGAEAKRKIRALEFDQQFNDAAIEAPAADSTVK